MAKETTMPNGPENNSARVYRRLLSYLKPYKRQFAFALVAMVLYGATDGIIPYLLKRILDDVFGSQNEQMLITLVGVIVAFALIRGIFGFLEKYLSAWVGFAIIRDLRNEINRKLLHLSSTFYLGNSTGNIISRVTNDTLLVRTALTDAAAALLRDSVRVVALLAVALYLDPTLALIAFIGFPLGIYPVIRFGKKVRRLSRSGQDHFGGLTSVLQESIVGHEVVQAFGREEFEHQRFAQENERFTSTFLRAEKYGALAGPTNEVIASFAIAGVILYGGFSVISGVRTQGDFIAFITALFLLYEPLKKISRINNSIQAGVAASERIFEVLDSHEQVLDCDDAASLSSKNPAIEYRNLWFRYPKAAQLAAPLSVDSASPDSDWVLKNVSLSIEPGKTLALVGLSGGGKSTLVRLLPRFYEPQRGEIFVDGRDIKEYTLRSLRASIAVVNQHTFLFNDTVFANIAYGRESASPEEIVAAAKSAHADEFIRKLPHGYETVIGEQGLSLSGGQRARLAIARALVRDAPILILDEATASLDSESEELVQDAINVLMKGRTVLVIAHRLATIREASAIAVIHRGELQELGTHDELLKRGGEYAKLYRLQFREQDDPTARQVGLS